MRGRVLIIDDEMDMCQILSTGLKNRDFEVVWSTSALDGYDLLTREDFDVSVTDLNMPDLNGIDFCTRVKSSHEDMPVIVITAFGSLETAIAAIRAGAYDFITKPFEMEELALAMDRAIQHRRLREEVRRLRQVVDARQSLSDIIGESPPMQHLKSLIARMANTETSVLITGETGTGKELVARSLHRLSRRSDSPFIAVDCAAVPETLLESELFGHVKGAFTDAKSERKGLFLQAGNGTILLDEIGNMPLGLQPKLLRALQERRVRPVGGDSDTPFEARIMAATNNDLETAVDEGRFRRDLFYRINVLYIEVPPLHARGTDVLLLAQHFIREFASRQNKPQVTGMNGAAAEKLCSYTWPGNVRELQNCIERAVALTDYELITVDDLPEKIQAFKPSHLLVAGDDPSELVTLEEVERRYILRVMETVRGNKALAARILGLDRTTLYRKLSQYSS